MAFRLLHEYLVEGECSSQQLTLSPHLITRGSLEHFLKGLAPDRDSKGTSGRVQTAETDDADDATADFAHSGGAFVEKDKN